MVARGDLAFEWPLDIRTRLQETTDACLPARGQAVVVATQMLESMISSPVPTRAEVSDVATAVFEGADAVMLSGRIAPASTPSRRFRPWRRSPATRARPHYPGDHLRSAHAPEATGADGISLPLTRSPRRLKLAAIVTYTSPAPPAARCARAPPGACHRTSPIVQTGSPASRGCGGAALRRHRGCDRSRRYGHRACRIVSTEASASRETESS